MLISFLYVPLLLHSMNSVNYGIWLTLTSFIAWIGVFDIGLGNGLRNRLATALAHKDYRLGKIYVSTAYTGIFLAVLCIAIVFSIGCQFINWQSLLNATSIDSTELNQLVAVVFVSFLANFSLSLINSVLFALQKPALSSFITFLGQLFSFLSVYILVTFLKINSLLILGIIISVVPIIVLLISTVYLFSKKYKQISPSLISVDMSKMKDLLSMGTKFFIIQIITIILFQTNNIIITHVVGNEAVVEYNVVHRYMNVFLMLYNIIAVPIWSAATDAYTKGDLAWIKKINAKLEKIATIFVLLGLFMLLISPLCYELWLGTESCKIHFSTSFLLYLYSVFMVFYSCYGYIINGIGKLSLQILITSITAILYIPVTLFLGKIFGLNGILFAFGFTSLINSIWSKIQLKKILSGTASGIWNK